MLTYLHGDHLGSASLATNASGAKITDSDTRYYPYGVTRPGLAGTGLPTDRRFTGQREETSLGFYDYVARQFDPALGRFLQADTIVPNPANPQSLNRYSYTLGNPLRYTDPSGHIAQEEETDAQSIVAYLRLLGFEIQIDWGMVAGFWNAGLWQLRELQLIQQAVTRLEQVFQGKPIQGSIISVVRANEDGTAANIQDSIIIRNDFLKAAMPQVAFVHEFAHAWDYFNRGRFSKGLPAFRGNEPGPTSYGSGAGLGTWSDNPPANEWAESVAAYVYPEYIAYLRTPGTDDYSKEQKWQGTLDLSPQYVRPGLGQWHKAYVALSIHGPFWPYVR